VPVVLRHVDGLSYDEMARVLGRPEGTLKAQVHRGLAQLRDAAERPASPVREEMTA
jgi:RNA polymerase sigma-70 factor (ECF subfamily)